MSFAKSFLSSNKKLHLSYTTGTAGHGGGGTGLPRYMGPSAYRLLSTTGMLSYYRKFIGGLTRTQLETSKVCSLDSLCATHD